MDSPLAKNGYPSMKTMKKQGMIRLVALPAAAAPMALCDEAMGETEQVPIGPGEV